MRDWSKCLAEEVRPGNVIEAKGRTIEVKHVWVEKGTVHYQALGQSNLTVDEGEQVDVYR